MSVAYLDWYFQVAVGQCFAKQVTGSQEASSMGTAIGRSGLSFNQQMCSAERECSELKL